MLDAETLTVVLASASCLAAVEFVVAKVFASIYPKLEGKAHEVSARPAVARAFARSVHLLSIIICCDRGGQISSFQS